MAVTAVAAHITAAAAAVTDWGSKSRQVDALEGLAALTAPLRVTESVGTANARRCACVLMPCCQTHEP